MILSILVERYVVKVKVKILHIFLYCFIQTIDNDLKRFMMHCKIKILKIDLSLNVSFDHCKYYNIIHKMNIHGINTNVHQNKSKYTLSLFLVYINDLSTTFNSISIIPLRYCLVMVLRFRFVLSNKVF